MSIFPTLGRVDGQDGQKGDSHKSSHLWKRKVASLQFQAPKILSRSRSGKSLYPEQQVSENRNREASDT